MQEHCDKFLAVKHKLLTTKTTTIMTKEKIIDAVLNSKVLEIYNT